jgi:hypothetical protein
MVLLLLLAMRYAFSKENGMRTLLLPLFPFLFSVSFFSFYFDFWFQFRFFLSRGNLNPLLHPFFTTQYVILYIIPNWPVTFSFAGLSSSYFSSERPYSSLTISQYDLATEQTRIQHRQKGLSLWTQQ